MGFLNYLYNTFRLPDNSIRPGETPTDGMMSVHKAPKAASTKIKVPYKAGSRVAYVVLDMVTVDSNQEITVNTNSANNPYVMVIAKSMNLQDGVDAL